MDRILAIDTSSDVCSVSIYNRGVWKSFHESIPRQHAKRLLGVVDRLLKDQNIEISDFDALIYGRGPGSFTGLRIASGVIQGFSLAFNIPVYGVSTLTALAMECTDRPPGSIILPCIDARMSQVYWCAYEIDEQGIPLPLQEEVVVDPHDVVFNSQWDDAIGIGSGWQYAEQMPDQLTDIIKSNELNIQPSAEQMIRWVLAKNPEAQQAGDVQPVYIRDKVTWDQKPRVGSK